MLFFMAQSARSSCFVAKKAKTLLNVNYGKVVKNIFTVWEGANSCCEQSLLCSCKGVSYCSIRKCLKVLNFHTLG